MKHGEERNYDRRARFFFVKRNEKHNKVIEKKKKRFYDFSMAEKKNLTMTVIKDCALIDVL